MRLIKKIINNKFKVLLLFLAVVSVPVFSGCGTAKVDSGYKVELKIWGTSDDSVQLTKIAREYVNVNPFVTSVEYRKFSMDTYKKELLEAFASGKGPDIFLINNAWLPSFENLVEPAPELIINQQMMGSNFPDVVLSDFIVDGKIYGVPLSVDSLELYYNKDIFNAAGITSTPKTWQEFDNNVMTLTSVDSVGNIVRSGAALGTGLNVNRASDILSMLMMQKGVQLPLKKGESFNFSSVDKSLNSASKASNAGEQALEYYTNFARLSSSEDTVNQLYTWNANKKDSIEEFAKGSVAMMFNYSWNYNKIKDKNPKLNFSVAPVPQEKPDKPVTYANYWGFVVARDNVAPLASGKTVPNEIRVHEAWQFLKFLTLKNPGSITLYNAKTKTSSSRIVNIDPALDYIKQTNQPAARRDIIEIQKADPFLGTFALGNLIAKHWYEADSDEIEKITIDMIDSVNRGEMDITGALGAFKGKVSSLSRRY